MISAVVLAEIELAPQNVKDHFERVLPDLEVIDISEEALFLRDAYIDEGIINS